MFDLVFQNLADDKRYNSKFFEKILIMGIKELKLSKKSIEVSVNLVRGSKIRELNRKYRNKNKVTDVLSFPMSEKFPKNPESRIQNLESIDLGDIFICLSFAKREAKSENIGIERKLAQLTVHGFLHLAGYDHERSKEEEKKMFKLECKILTSLFHKQ